MIRNNYCRIHSGFSWYFNRRCGWHFSFCYWAYILNIFEKNKNAEPRDLEYRHQNNSKPNVKYSETEQKKIVIAITKEEDEMLNRKIK